MTPKERAAMQQALEALEGIQHGTDWNNGTHAKIYRPKFPAAITALREALAEPQITTPDVCGEVCARAKLCYGCNKDLEEANAKYGEQAEQEPVAYAVKSQGSVFSLVSSVSVAEEIVSMLRNDCPDTTFFALYAAPVRTKDLTDDEIDEIGKSYFDEWSFGFARAVIAADREKNK